MVLIYFAAPRPPLMRGEQGFRSAPGLGLCKITGGSLPTRIYNASTGLSGVVNDCLFVGRI